MKLVVDILLFPLLAWIVMLTWGIIASWFAGPTVSYGQAILVTLLISLIQSVLFFSHAIKHQEEKNRQ